MPIVCGVRPHVEQTSQSGANQHGLSVNRIRAALADSGNTAIAAAAALDNKKSRLFIMSPSFQSYWQLNLMLFALNVIIRDRRILPSNNCVDRFHKLHILVPGPRRFSASVQFLLRPIANSI